MTTDTKDEEVDGEDEDSVDDTQPPPSIDVDRMKEMINELRPIVEDESEWLMESEQDFMRLFRFNILILGAYVSVISLSVDLLTSTDTPNISIQSFGADVSFYYSFGMWLTSTLTAVLAYGGLRARLGSEQLFRSDDYERDTDNHRKLYHFDQSRIRDIDFESDEYYEHLLDEYVKSNSINHHESQLRYGLYLVALLLLVASVVLFTLGFWISVFGGKPLLSSLAFGVFIFGGVLSAIGLSLGGWNLLDKYRNKLKRWKGSNE